MSDDTSKPMPAEKNAGIDERAENLGCGFGLLVAGVLLLASQLGWVKGIDWLLPAVIIGMAVNYLYKAFRGK